MSGVGEGKEPAIPIIHIYTYDMKFIQSNLE